MWCGVRREKGGEGEEGGDELAPAAMMAVEKRVGRRTVRLLSEGMVDGRELVGLQRWWEGGA
jgi:hypothetical protein